jgi:CRP-like cAMP-binding protein
MDYALLSELPIFKGLDAKEISSILTGLPHRVRKFQAGSVISQSGDHVDSLMLIIMGAVKGEMVDYSGRIIKIEDIHAPGTLAPAFLFGNLNLFPVNVIAISDTELLVINKSDFLKLMMKNDRILVNFLDMISNRSQFLSEKIKFLNFKTIKGKLAQYFLKLAADPKKEIRLDRTQSDLADYFGVARPSVARVLKEMEEECYIKTSGKKITILDKKKLINLTKD